jgi:hypothetical protein
MDSNESTDDALRILESIIERPAMYWGNSPNHFHSFVAFQSGIMCTLGTDCSRSPLGDLIPSHFDHFVTEYYGHKFPQGGFGWASFIEEHSASDREALSLLLTLRRLYSSSRFPALDEQLAREIENDHHVGAALGDTHSNIIHSESTSGSP